MKKTIIISLFLISALLLHPKDWLIMVYIGADNNLCSYLNSDVDEMEKSYTDTTSLDIVIQVDGMGKSGGGYTDLEGSKLTDARRYKLGGNGNGTNNIIDEHPLVKLGEINSGIPQSVVNFVSWAKNNYPADNYAIVMWDHGAGWAKGGKPVKGGIWDDTDGSSFLSGAQGTWRQALKDSRDTIGQDFAFIGHDMCVMSYMEVLWDEYDLTDMVVISEANVPGLGWNYEGWIEFIAEHPDTDLSAIGEAVVDAYSSEYATTSATMTYMLMDATEMESLKNLIFLLAAELVNNNGGRDDADVQLCIGNTLPMSSGTFYEDFKDLWSFCDQLQMNSGITANAKSYAAAIKSAIDNLNPYDWQYGFTGSHGIGIYLPDSDPLTVWGSAYNNPNHRWFHDCWPWYDFISGAVSTRSNMTSVKCSEDGESILFEIESAGTEDWFEVYRDGMLCGKTRSSFRDEKIYPGMTYYYEVFANSGGERSLLYGNSVRISDMMLHFSISDRMLSSSKVKKIEISDISGRTVYRCSCSGYSEHDLSFLRSGLYRVSCDGAFKKTILIL